MPRLQLPRGRTVLRGGLLFVALLATAELFSSIYLSATAPTLIWPIPGVALAGILLGGPALWPAVALAIFVHQSLQGSSFVLALGLAFANTVQPLIGAWLLNRFGFTKAFSRVPETLAFAAVAFFITMIVPTIGLLVLALDDYAMPRGLSGTWFPWWIGQMLSVLIITPLLTRWLSNPFFNRTTWERIEIVLAFVSLIAIDLLLFWTPFVDLGGVPLIYLVLGPFLWFALRIGPRFMTLALFVNAALALSGTAYAATRAGNILALGDMLFQTEIFIIMISFIFLVLAAIAKERKDTADDLRKNVEELEDAVERIRKEDEAKSRFIATLAHELRNPLAPLMTSLEVLKLEKPAPGRIGAMASAMEEHVKTMRHLLDDLLDISRITREKLTLQKESVELAGIVSKSVRTIAPIIEERGHTLTVELPGRAITLEADPVRLEQILVNLLNNAAKYTEPGGTITLLAEVTDQALIIRVRDSGIGIDSDVLEQVFEPFFQLNSNDRRVSGLGIGLSLTRNLVEMHGGRITAQSDGAGRGSEFIVRLPLQNLVYKDTGSVEGIPAPTEPSEDRKFRILVVDDNQAAADGLVKLLTLRGHAASAVYTGEDGIRHAPVYGPDVVLLDIGLPDMEGYDVARALKADDSVEATLIALTGYGQESDIRKAEKAGFDHHLTKPAGLAEIEELLRRIA